LSGKMVINKQGRRITHHFTPKPGYSSLLERVFGREMRTKPDSRRYGPGSRDSSVICPPENKEPKEAVILRSLGRYKLEWENDN